MDTHIYITDLDMIYTDITIEIINEAARALQNFAVIRIVDVMGILRSNKALEKARAAQVYPSFSPTDPLTTLELKNPSHDVS